MLDILNVLNNNIQIVTNNNFQQYVLNEIIGKKQSIGIAYFII